MSISPYAKFSDTIDLLVVSTVRTSVPTDFSSLPTLYMTYYSLGILETMVSSPYSGGLMIYYPIIISETMEQL